MSDKLPTVTTEFLSSEQDGTSLKTELKKGGPYTKSDRVKRRNEVFRLHFSIGYSAVKISELLHVNRHTIESDIKHGYSILSKEWEKSDVVSWFMKQVYRLEEQRTRLLKKLESLTGREYLATENLLKEIDVKIFYMQKEVITSKEIIHEINIKEINRYLQQNFSDDRIVSIFGYRKVSVKTADTINELIKKRSAGKHRIVALIFFNKTGKAILFTSNKNDLFSFNGTPIGYIQNDSVYAYFGAHLAWFFDGWILNHNGEVLFFTKNAVGGPGRPAIQSIPNKLTPQTTPTRRPRASTPSRPPKRNSWGNTNDLSKISLKN